MQDHMGLVVASSHEWAGQEVTRTMLRNESWLLRESLPGSRLLIEHALSEADLKLKDLQINMEIAFTEGL